MDRNNGVPKTISGAARELTSLITGELVLPNDDRYVGVRQLWNGAVAHEPALIVVCETSQDVKEAIRVARMYGIPMSVRGGGHDWAGRALCDGGLVIDLSRMRETQIDASNRVAVVSGGAQASDLMAAAAPHHLVAVTGTVGGVGVAGLTLGGGYGPLTPRFGLALDNLLAADLGLADGQLITASDSENPELFWALRGGGNFGVVTSLQVRLHALREVLAGVILFAWTEAESVLRGYADIMKAASDELSVLAAVLSSPDGSPLLMLASTWCGERNQREEMLAYLTSLGKTVMAQIGSMPYGELLRLFDAHVVTGRHYAVQTRSFSELTPESVATLIEAVDHRTSPLSIIAIHHLHGFPTRVPADHTAFGQRAEHFMMEIISAWEPQPDDDDSIHREWAQNLSGALAAYALPGGYPNMLGPAEEEQIVHGYGENSAKLLRLKAQYDPDNVFSSAIPLPRERATHSVGS